MQKITKAIIPAAGLGTRFLPQTKAMPKEMLPVIDKPIIQYVVEEAVAAGITDIIIVTGPHKRAIEDHFDHQYELENNLEAKGKTKLAGTLRDIADMANFIYLRQKGHPGNGTPILNASHLLGDEPFLVLWGDDFVNGNVPRAKQLVDAYEKHGAPVISLIPIMPDQSSKYGVPIIKTDLGNGLYELGGLMEKPGPEKAPSSFASVGGYILPASIIPLLEAQNPVADGEVYLTAAINELMQQERVLGQVLEGKWHDTGNPESYLEAIVDVALTHPEFGDNFRDYLEERLK